MGEIHPVVYYLLVLLAVSLLASTIVVLHRTILAKEGFRSHHSKKKKEEPPAAPANDTPTDVSGAAPPPPPPPPTEESPPPTEESPPPADVDPATRAAAINNLANSSTPIVPNGKKTEDDLITEINTFILKNMTHMLDIYTYLPSRIDGILENSYDLTDQTCQIVREIESRYVGRPKAEADAEVEEDKEDEPMDNLNDWTYDDKTEKKYEKKMNKLEKEEEKAEKKGDHKMSQLKQRYNRQKKQFQNKHKDNPMLECFVGSSQDLSGADLSGANMFHLDKLAPITSFGPPIVSVTDLSGNIIEGTSLEDAMKNKHILENKQIIAVEIKLLKRVSQVNEFVKSYEYVDIIEKLKRIPVTAQFSAQFVKKYLKSVKITHFVNKIKGFLHIGHHHKHTKEGFRSHHHHKHDTHSAPSNTPYQNKHYTFPVPYTDLQLNDEQKNHLEILNNANTLWMQLQTELGPIFDSAQLSYNRLSADWSKMSETS